MHDHILSGVQMTFIWNEDVVSQFVKSAVRHTVLWEGIRTDSQSRFSPFVSQGVFITNNKNQLTTLQQILESILFSVAQIPTKEPIPGQESL